MSATAVFSVKGMTCGACTSAVTNGIQSIAGVEDVSVSLMTERAKVQYNGDLVNAVAIKEGIEDCGFDAEVIEADDNKKHVTFATADVKGQGKIFRLKVMGMTCSTCSNSVEQALRSVPGVKSALVNLTTEDARIVADPELVGVRTLVEAVEDAGFDALLADALDNSSQLSALSRVREIQQYRRDSFWCFVLSIPMILSMHMFLKLFPFLHFLTAHIAGSLYLDDIISFCLATPIQILYGARFYKKAYSAIKHRAPNMDVLVSISTSCAYCFSVVSWLSYLVFINDGARAPTLWETSAMVILFVTFGKYLESKAKGQTSVAISKLINLVPSQTTVYTSPTRYNAKLNREVEGSSEGAQNTVEQALETKIIPTDIVQINDIVVLKPGEKVPADGVIVQGESYVSEALITGESMPLYKSKGDLIVGGSVNGSGQLDFKVLRAGDDTKLAQIIRLVQDAQINKAPVQRFADYAAGYFVPIVLLLALATFVFWVTVVVLFKKVPVQFQSEEGNFMACVRLCISVIVVACPCALGLATPTAVMVASGVAADNGILIKGGQVLETAQEIDTVVFDKTGTLTCGRHEVGDFQFIGDKLTTVEMWRVLRAVESRSEHPVAKGVIKKANEVLGDETGDLAVENFQALVGKGASCTVELARGTEMHRLDIAVGTRKLLEDLDVNDIPNDEHESSIPGQTCIYVSVNRKYSGRIGLHDQIRPEAKLTVEALRSQGYKVGMLSGDSRSVALRVAKSVGISADMVWAEISPAGKLEKIEMLRQADEFQINSSEFVIEDEVIGTSNGGRRPGGHRIAMVGDGINDSPALAVADLGISISGATHAAIEAADIVLIKDQEPLIDIANALDLSRVAFRRIKFNLFAAVVYNICMIPIAMGVLLPFGVWLHPMMASAAMAMSSLSVLASSLLLQLWRPRQWDQQLHRESRWSRVRNWFQSRDSFGYKQL